MKFYSFFSFNWFKYLLENLLFFFLVLLHHFTISAIQFSLFRTSINLRLICPLHLTFSLQSSLFPHFLLRPLSFSTLTSFFTFPSFSTLHFFSNLLSFSALPPSPPFSPSPSSVLLHPPLIFHLPPLSASPLSAFSALCTIYAHCCCLWEFLDLYPPTVAVSGSTWIYIPPLLLFLGVPGSISPHC